MSIFSARHRAGIAVAGAMLAAAVLCVPTASASAHRPQSIYHDPSAAKVARYIAHNADKPYMGWSSWSLQATHAAGVNPQGNYSWLTADHVLAQGAALAKTLKSHGYDYVNIDAGWWRTWDWTPEYDQYGRPAVDAARFPNGDRRRGAHPAQRGAQGRHLHAGRAGEGRLRQR